MTEILEQAEIKLKDWVLVCTGSWLLGYPVSNKFETPNVAARDNEGDSFVGRERAIIPRPGGRILLSPVYQVVGVTQIDGGRRLIGTSVTPLLWLASVERLVVPADLPCIEVNNLSKEEKQRIFRAIQDCENSIREMKTVESGIVVAKTLS